VEVGEKGEDYKEEVKKKRSPCLPSRTLTIKEEKSPKKGKKKESALYFVNQVVNNPDR